MHALVALNVVQNCLISHDPCWQYFANLLRSLLARPVCFYITEYDLKTAQHYFNYVIQSGYPVDEVCQEVYLGLLDRVKVCPVDRSIWEESAHHRLILADRIRLACALDYNLDAIVTYEPQSFALTPEHLYNFQINGYYAVADKTECGETGDHLLRTVEIFSVTSFLIYLDRVTNNKPLLKQSYESFCIQDFQLCCENAVSHATITLMNSIGVVLRASAIRSAPMDAIQTAIDQMVNQCVEMPVRHLIRYAIPLASLCNAESPVNVVICIECNGTYFEHSACSVNSIRAAADAYTKAINEICEYLSLPIFQPKDEA